MVLLSSKNRSTTLAGFVSLFGFSSDLDVPDSPECCEPTGDRAVDANVF